MLPRSILLLCLVLSSQPASAAVRLPQVFSDHMLLQRDVAVAIWGWADTGEEVTVAFAGQAKRAVADGSGRWVVRLDPMPASRRRRTPPQLLSADNASSRPSIQTTFGTSI